jgi:hypothetical protein
VCEEKKGKMKGEVRGLHVKDIEKGERDGIML